MGVIEERRREVIRALGVGIRGAKDQEQFPLGNKYGDVVLLVETAKRVHKPGADSFVDAAMKAVEGSLPPAEAAYKKRVAEKQIVPELERILVPNFRKNLLIVVELAEQYVNQDSEIHGQAGPDVAA